MLSTAEMLDMQAMQVASMTDTCDVLATTTTPGPYLDETETEVVAAAGVPCRLAAAGGREDGGGGFKVTAVAQWTLTVPAGTPITPATRVRVTSRTPVVLLEVVAGPRSTYGTADRWTCVAVA